MQIRRLNVLLLGYPSLNKSAYFIMLANSKADFGKRQAEMHVQVPRRKFSSIACNRCIFAGIIDLTYGIVSTAVKISNIHSSILNAHFNQKRVNFYK